MKQPNVVSFVLFICAVLLLSGCNNDALPLKRLSGWKIIVSNNAIESEKYAAVEFQRMLEESVGIKIEIVETAPVDLVGGVYIGADICRAAGLSITEMNYGEEGFSITVDQSHIAIVGGRPRGVLYGVYEFFEEKCGARYLTTAHTYYPSNIKSAKIPFGTSVFTPPLSYRFPYYGETIKDPVFATRIRANTVTDDERFGGKSGFANVSHNVAYLVPPEKYGKSHPEYFALVDGERKLQMGGGGPQLCMSNPDLVDIITEAVIERIKSNPMAKNIDIAHMDNKNYCTCPNCAAIDEREESHAGSILSMVNAVAEKVEKLYPDLYIGTYAYEYTRKPPKTIKPRKNVMIQLCSIECCCFHSIDDPTCEMNRAFCADMEGWNRISDNIFIWHYNTNFMSYMTPFPNLRSMGKSVNFFVNCHGKGIFMQAAGNGFSTELSDLRNYVMARSLWKPGRDSWEEAMEFCKLHYAEAAQPIIDYLTYYHDLVDNKGMHPACFASETALCLNKESVKQIMGYFDQALSMAKSEEVRQRVEKASLSAYRAVLSIITSKMNYKEGFCSLDYQGFDSNAIDRYIALCDKFGVTMDSELITNETYLTSIQKIKDGFKAVCVENDHWRVVVIPESNAKIVEMVYKPTNRNITQAYRAFGRFRFEEWSQLGEGPMPGDIYPFELIDVNKDEVQLRATLKDGSTLTRSIKTDGNKVRFATTIQAGVQREFRFWIHPEFDLGTSSFDTNLVPIYVQNPKVSASIQTVYPEHSTPKQVKEALEGGTFGFFSKEAGYGVMQKYDPKRFSSLELFWSPSRQQINLEMMTQKINLRKGESTSFGYEIGYLDKPLE